MLSEILFSSYLGDGEDIIKVFHRHITLALGSFIKYAFLGIGVPLFVWWVFPGTWIFMLAWGWIGVLRIVYEFIDWYFDAWVVTNVSIIQIQWDGFFSKSSTRIEYHNIESITYEIKGFWRTVFNIGNITIEKITGNFDNFQGTGGPKRKVDNLMKHVEYFVAEKNVRDHQSLKNLMSDMLQGHFLDSKKDKQRK